MFLLAAIWQLLLALVQAGKLSWMFSDIAMSGYTAGAGIGIFTSQVKTVLGLKLKRFSGILSLVYVSINPFDINIFFCKFAKFAFSSKL